MIRNELVQTDSLNGRQVVVDNEFLNMLICSDASTSGWNAQK